MSVSNQHTLDATEDQDRRAAVFVTTYFCGRIREIGRYWRGLGTQPAFERLMELLQRDVIPALERDPEAGHRLNDEPPQADDDAPLPDMLRERASPCSDVFQYAFGDDTTGRHRILYLLSGDSLHLLSIRAIPD